MNEQNDRFPVLFFLDCAMLAFELYMPRLLCFMVLMIDARI